MTLTPQRDVPVDGIIQKLRLEFPRLQEQYAIERLEIFGSYARNMQRPESDVDILVSFTTIPGLLKYITLENHLSELLGLPVDLVMEQSLKPDIASRIASDRKPI
jgi:hypothetical protein